MTDNIQNEFTILSEYDGDVGHYSLYDKITNTKNKQEFLQVNQQNYVSSLNNENIKIVDNDTNKIIIKGNELIKIKIKGASTKELIIEDDVEIKKSLSSDFIDNFLVKKK